MNKQDHSESFRSESFLKERLHFLQQKWNPYPVAPAEAISGWIVSVSLQAERAQIQLQTSGKILSFSVQQQEALQWLIPGDIVALTSSVDSSSSDLFHLHWLVPCQSSPLQAENRVKKVGSTLKDFSEFFHFLRYFFETQGFQEILTPTLVSCPGTEPYLDPFQTQLQVGSQQRRLFLPTSPELHLKKALHLRFEKIFEIAKVYRNGELSPQHQPEFWMLEWYRAFQPLSHLQDDIVQLIQEYGQKVASAKQPRKVIKTTIRALFQEHFHFDLKPQTSLEELSQLAHENKIDMHAARTIDDYFFLLFLEIEKKLNPEDLIFVSEYPPYQAALARLNQQGWAERFEVYWQGFELANAFAELNHPQVQRERAESDLVFKNDLGKMAVSLDEDFFKALQGGMPPASGVALGVERLFMALHGIRDLRDLRLFPFVEVLF